MNKFRIIVVIGVGVLLIGAAITGLVLWNESDEQVSQSESYSQLCNGDDVGKNIKSEFPEVPAEKTSDMKFIIDRILDTQSHEKSVNCLFVLARYNSHTGQTDEAIRYYDELVHMHKSTGEWVDGAISRMQPNDVEASSQFLKEGGGIRRQYIANPQEDSE